MLTQSYYGKKRTIHKIIWPFRSILSTTDSDLVKYWLKNMQHQLVYQDKALQYCWEAKVSSSTRYIVWLFNLTYVKNNKYNCSINLKICSLKHIWGCKKNISNKYLVSRQQVKIKAGLTVTSQGKEKQFLPCHFFCKRKWVSFRKNNWPKHSIAETMSFIFKKFWHFSQIFVPFIPIRKQKCYF